MSEKIYGWLWRLYPAHFREAYGEEALQLFCDRARDEPGFFSGIRLWLDLVADLIVSVQQRCVPPLPVGAPLLHVLESESLHVGALLFGSALSLVAFGACSTVIQHGGNRGAIHVSRRPVFMLAAADGDVEAGERQRVFQAAIAS